MTNDSLEYSTLSRLLTLNNRVHDLENELRLESLPRLPMAHHVRFETDKINRIAQMQEDIDQGVRASLVACWMGMDDDPFD